MQKIVSMSEKELNAYRLTSMEEPTDEMLSAIMREAAEEATLRWKAAEQRFFQEINDMVARQRIADAV
jgi:glutamate dehydrogenase/leucine dehydrogenase